MSLAIQISGLKKSYNGTEALKGVNLSIKEGEFYALLGPNGAGKTTMINILTGLVIKNEGTTEVFGKDTIKEYRFTRSQIGTAAQELPSDWFFPIEKLLYFQAGYFGISSQNAKPRVDELMERLGLTNKKGSKLRQLSGGMKRRFQLAKALIHDPNILILDEPTAGVDVELRHELWDYFRELHKRGKTILLTTHYIEEAEMLCENVSIIHEGKVIKEGSPKALTQSLGKAGITIHFSGWNDLLEPKLSDFSYTHEDGRLHFTVQDSEKTLPEIIAILAGEKCRIQSVKTDQSSLEDVFLSLTGKGIREEQTL